MTQVSQPKPDPRLAARVPRYTSYPPANHFNPAVGGGQVQRWLRDVDPDDPISLYIHIPFCRRLCWFCACRTQGTKTAAPIDGYIDILNTEIGLVRAALPDGVGVGQMHWGGGTPTLLTPAQVKRLGGLLRDAFPMADTSEFAVEIDPTELDDARLDALAALGLARASVGVQDFDPRIQAAIGREQSAQITLEAIRGLRARGVQSLNVDLLYGLPFQTPQSLAETLDVVVGLAPDRLALYGYAHVPWMSKRQRLIPEDALPPPPERLELSETARHILMNAGYVPIGIDHFAKPGDSMAAAAAAGHLRRNFQGYTTDRYTTLIGLGASAVSRYPHGFAQNAARTGDWAKALSERHLPTARGHVFSGADRLRGRVIEEIMCQFRVDIDAVADELGMEASQLDADLDRLLLLYPDAVDQAGAQAGRKLALSHGDGRFARIVAAVFDGYMAPDAQTYSLAV